MKPGRLARWAGALLLAGFIASAGQALAQSGSVVTANPQNTLVSQPSNSNVPPSNTDGSHLPLSNSQAADDFIVPNNVFWHITSASALGRDVGLTGSGTGSLVVQFYLDTGGGLPGIRIYNVNYPNGSYTDQNPGTLVVPLNPILVVGPGHYWFSVQPQIATCPDTNCRNWLWNESPGPFHAESAWQGNWVSSCKVWQPRVHVCKRPLDSSGNDLAFELDGTSVPVVAQIFLPLIRR